MGLSVSQLQGREEFAVHAKMGRPVITTAESLKRVMAEQPTGLIVIEEGHFSSYNFVPPETAMFIEANTLPIPLPESTGIKAYRWGGPVKPISDLVSPDSES